MRFMMLVCVDPARFAEDEAVQVASAHPVAGFGKIEVRAVWTL